MIFYLTKLVYFFNNRTLNYTCDVLVTPHMVGFSGIPSPWQSTSHTRLVRHRGNGLFPLKSKDGDQITEPRSLEDVSVAVAPFCGNLN